MNPSDLGRIAARQGVRHLISRLDTHADRMAFQIGFHAEKQQIRQRRSAYEWAVSADGNAEHRLTKGELL